jgi:MFS-type transporter involved in bile tolerance (Atg22 family)
VGRVRHPPSEVGAGATGQQAASSAARSILVFPPFSAKRIDRSLPAAVTHLRGSRQISTAPHFLIAFWLYNNGIGTIIKMATAVGDEIGIEMSDLIAAILITQFVGILYAFAFGRLGRFIGSKRAILVGLVGYMGISIGGYCRADSDALLHSRFPGGDRTKVARKHSADRSSAPWFRKAALPSFSASTAPARASRA